MSKKILDIGLRTVNTHRTTAGQLREGQRAWPRASPIAVPICGKAGGPFGWTHHSSQS